MNTPTKLVSDREILAELESIEMEISELEADLGDLGLDDDVQSDSSESSSELSELESVLAGTEFESAATKPSGGLSILEIADGAIPEESFQEGILGSLGKIGQMLNPIRLVKSAVKGKARSIIRKITGLVRKYAKLAPCAPKVTAAVVAFKAGQYGTALKAGWSAYKCIKQRI